MNMNMNMSTEYVVLSAARARDERRNQRVPHRQQGHAHFAKLPASMLKSSTASASSMACREQGERHSGSAGALGGTIEAGV